LRLHRSLGGFEHGGCTAPAIGYDPSAAPPGVVSGIANSDSLQSDLEKIGILLGHRRKILAAIAEMTGSAAAAPRLLPRSSQSPNPSAAKSR
jgi:hypothetical protein